MSRGWSRDQPTTHPSRRVYGPALCLVAATAVAVAVGSEVGEHALSLSAIEVVGVGLTDALRLGRIRAEQVPWEYGHTISTCRPELSDQPADPWLPPSPHRTRGMGPP